MHPFPHPLYGVRRPPAPVFVGAGKNAGGVAPLVLPAGVMPGDTLLWTNLLGSVSGGAGPAIGAAPLLGRRLVSADLAPGVFTMSSYVVWCVYRGLFNVHSRSNGSAVGDVYLAGFNKAQNCAGLLVTGMTYAPTGSAPTATPPMISRMTVHDGGTGSGASIGDLLDPTLYTNGASVRFSGSTGFGSTTVGYLFEAVF